MLKKQKKPNFSSFGKKTTEVSVAEVPQNITVASKVETRHVQARLIKKDSIRFKRAAEDNGFTQHDGLIEAINLMMRQWGESPVSNVGATKKII